MKEYWDKKSNFAEYKNAQEQANKPKLKKVWVRESEIKIMSDWLKEYKPNIKFGICHGSRSGFEVEKFREYLNVNVIGTDISETALLLPNMIQWDMHDVKDEWINNVDFIYSNAIDHTYDVHLCLKKWLSCLKNDGVLLLHISNQHFKLNPGPVDCFKASKEEYASVLTGKGVIIDTIESIIKSRHRFIWIIEKLIGKEADE